MTEQGALTPAAKAGPKGIGGWLILPTIGLIVTPIRAMFSLPATYSGIADSAGYLTVAQRVFVYCEIVLNIAILIVLPLVLLVLLFQKKYAFIRWYAIWGVANIALMIVDIVVAKAVFPDVFITAESLFDGDTVKELFRSLVLVAIWVPYMLQSRRVANTFVN